MGCAITTEFITSSMTSDNFGTSYVTIPVSSLVRPMFVYGDYGGMKDKYFYAHPKRNWARYFGDKIKQSPLDNNVTLLQKDNESMGEVEEILDDESGVWGGFCYCK